MSSRSCIRAPSPPERALEAALERFASPVVCISHDRYFLDRIVEVAGGGAVAREGGYSDWAERRARAGAVKRPVGYGPGSYSFCT